MRKSVRLTTLGTLAVGLAALLAAGQGALGSEDLRLELPVDCKMGAVCVVQHYVDMAPGSVAQDHTCGSLTYQGHDGVDFRTLRFAQMYDGVDVVAAAPGVVLRTRDAMPDAPVRNEADINALKGRDAGNGVVLDHGQGWETQYSHLKRGSIVVRPGDRVTAGLPLGQIGLSGKTSFPHLHFSLRRNGKKIDPFSGFAPESGCGKSGGGWWSETALKALAYRPGGLLDSGFSGQILDYPKFLERREEPKVSSTSPVLITWLVAWGLRKGDRWSLRMVDPAGRVLVEKSETLPANKSRWYSYVGKKRPASGWPRGTYRSEVKIVRLEGAQAGVLAERRHSIELP